MSVKLSSTEMILPRAIISYPHLFKARAIANTGGDPKFSAVFLLDPAQIQTWAPMVQAAINAAIQNKFSGSTPLLTGQELLNHPGRLRMPIAMSEDKPGWFMMRAYSDEDRPPQVVSATKVPLSDPTMVFAGCIVNAYVNLYGYNTAGNQGVGCGLRAVQLLDNVNVTRMDGGKSADDVFDVVQGAPEPMAAQSPGFQPVPPPQAQSWGAAPGQNNEEPPGWL